MATASQWELEYWTNQDRSTNVGAEVVSLHDDGWVPVNFYDANMPVQLAGVPESDVSNVISTGHLGPSQIMLVSQMTDDDSDALLVRAAAISGKLRSVNAFYPGREGYLRLRTVNSGSTLVNHYRFCVPSGNTFPMRAKTQMQATQAGAALNFTTTDPGLYADYEDEQIIVAGGGAGTGNTGAFNPSAAGSNTASYRCYIRIAYTTTALTSVRVWGTWFDFTITDPLSANYWMVDTMWNQVTYLTTTDKIDKFSGQFPVIVGGTSETIYVDCGAGNGCQVDIRYMPRLF